MIFRLAVVLWVFVLFSAQGVLADEANDIVESADAAGVKKCLPRIEQITNHLVSGAQSGAFILSVAPAPDQLLSSVSLEVQQPSGVVSYASLTSAPGATEGCSNTYETVTHWKNSCSEVASSVYANLTAKGPLQKRIEVLSDGQTLRIYLLPAGEQGCVVIKKEVLF